MAELKVQELRAVDGLGLAGLAEKVETLARRAATAQVVDYGDATKRLLVVDGVVERELPVPDRHHPPKAADEPRTLDSLLRYAANRVVTCPNAEIWVGEDAIVFWHDRHWRDEQATFTLSKTRACEALEALLRGQSQPDLVRLLRTALKGRVVGTNLLAIVRTLNFKQQAETIGNVQNTAQSFGRSVASEVSGADRLPEEVTIVAPVFASLEMGSFSLEPLRMDLAVTVNFEKQQILFEPVGPAYREHVSSALSDLADAIVERLAEMSVAIPVFVGTAETA